MQTTKTGNQPIFIIGDIHGDFAGLKTYLIERYIEKCTLICVGDLGIGFQYTREGELEGCAKLNKFFEENKIDFLSIRGNHDDPAYFDGSVNLSNFKLLKDYTKLTLNDQKFLFVGGAISVDRRVRVPGRSYWEDEKFVLKPELVEECDVLVTHTPPSWNTRFSKVGIEGWCDRDATLWDECAQERKDIDELIVLSKAKQHYAGHMHVTSNALVSGCNSTVLDIAEIKEHR